MNELATFTDKLDNNLSQNAEGVWCMNSLAIAELTGKRHDHVMTDIRTMFGELGKAAPDFSGAAFYTVNNAQREREIFNLPKHECMVLVTGYSVKLRSEVLKRWQLLEDAEAERQQAALIRAAQALEQEREARTKLQQDYSRLSFQLLAGKSSVRADIFDWKLRFRALISAHTRKPDMYGEKHTPKDAVDALAPYADEALRLISIAINTRLALGLAMVKCGVNRDTIYKVMDEFETYVVREADRESEDGRGY